MIDKYDHLKINKDEISKWMGQIDVRKDSPSLVDDLEFKNLEERLNFLFLFCILNFCFWSNMGWKYQEDNKVYSGSTAVIRSLYSSYQKGELSLNVDSILDLTFYEFSSLIKGEGNLHLMKERYELVISSFRILKNSYSCSVDNLVRAYNFDAELLKNELPNIFKSFEDKYLYKGKSNNIAKKAQVFISNLNKVYPGKPFKNIEKFTLFADYRLPQIFRHLGFFEYSKELEDIIDNGKQIARESEYEMEIRLATIDVGEFILKNHPNKSLTSIDLDGFFWALAKEKSDQMKPHHKVLTDKY